MHAATQFDLPAL